MAWHMPQELMNNNPLPESKVRPRFEAKGYKIIDYIYKNNMTRMNCYDHEGYIVKISLDSLRANTKTYVRFSPTYNLENLVYNLNHHRELHPELPEIKSWEYKHVGTKQQKQVFLTCICPECGAEIVMPMWNWLKGIKIFCNECIRLQSGLERSVEDWLKENNITYVKQKRFPDCKRIRPLPFDFYLPERNACIEVDGEQHSQYYKGKFYSEEEHRKLKESEEIKNKYCQDKSIRLLRLPYTLFRNGSHKLYKYEEVLSNFLL